MAHPRHDAVRGRYDFRCGYCGVSEVDTGGELTVDHYQPLAAGGGDEEENLVYACARCNQYKGDYFPSAPARAAGRRVLHPLRDDPSTHLREDPESARLEGITDTGRFHISLLRLNRSPLIQRRLRLRLDDLRALRQELLEMEVAQLRRAVASLRATIRLPHPPLDQNPAES